MLLTEIASFINISSNNQLSPEQVMLIMDGVQKSAFQKNQAAFLQYNQILQIRQTLSFDSVDYTNCTDADIGKPIVSVSGKTGTIVAFDNTIFIWQVVTQDGFLANEFVSITGGSGNGNLLGSNFQAIIRGPYSAPTDPECRKVWGITQRKPERFWLDFLGCCGIYWVNGILNSGDYLAFWGPRAPFETGLIDDLQNTFIFSFDPSPKATYYWVYWRNPPSITGLDDSTQLLVPEAYHLQFIQACNAAAASLLSGQPYSDATIEQFLGGWIDTLRAPFRDQKLNENMSQGRSTGYGYSGYGGTWV